MKSTEQQEEEFLMVFEDLIKTFSYDSNLETDKQKGFSKGFLLNFDSVVIESNQIQNKETAASSLESYPSENPRLNKKFNEFMSVLEVTNFRHYIIPYDKITKCVFENTPQEVLDKFTPELHRRGDSYFLHNKSTKQNEQSQMQKSEELDAEKLFYKILRHIDLALVQKDTFTHLQLKEIDVLKKEQQKLIQRYEKLKNDAEVQYRNMLTQFITILGIFAAILMGAFGAIQGFTSLFANAHDLSIGKLLIISSIGASSIILILFFLLNAIAKLTNRKLWSNNKEDANLLEKHPSLVITHGILIFILLVGASLELSSIRIQFAWQGLWWIIPFLWISYLITATHKKNFLFFSNWIKRTTNNN